MTKIWVLPLISGLNGPMVSIAMRSKGAYVEVVNGAVCITALSWDMS